MNVGLAPSNPVIMVENVALRMSSDQISITTVVVNPADYQPVCRRLYRHRRYALNHRRW